ncbi:MAG: tRNA (adenosine(37)-N6)-dimethylallyltransferase MiaA [Owenweeksia sp.]
MSKKAIFICGPTAVGKTDVSLKLAEWLKTEIISFDSRQFFRELQVGSAPPSFEEQQRIPHHFIGHLSVAQDYNAGDFEQEALRLMEKLFQEKDTVILVCGSGLYMKALTEGFDDMPDVNPVIRTELNRKFLNEGIENLQKELKEKDPDYFQKVDIKNPQRIIRALEVIRSTGKPYSGFRKREKADRPFRILKIGIELPRPELYQRINKRVEAMLDHGLEKEVRSLEAYRDKNALKTVGYKEFFQFFDEEISREEAVKEIQKNSRRYAKRQLTWFKRDPEITWFSPYNLAAIQSYIIRQWDS